MKELNNNITPKHIYVLINENRNGFKDQVMKTFGIDGEKIETSYNDSSSNDSCIEANNSIDVFSKKFDLIISSEQWKTIMPIRKIYGRRCRYVLQSGWTDVIVEKAWQQQKINCTIIFKKHDIHESSSAKHYISIHGTCKECKAIMNGKVMHRPRDNVDVKIHCIIYNIVEENHTYKKK